MVCSITQGEPATNGRHLLSSVGFLRAEFPELAALAAAYRFYGCAQVRRISGDPGTSGLFETFDPLDPFSKQGQRFHVEAAEDGIPDANG